MGHQAVVRRFGQGSKPSLLPLVPQRQHLFFRHGRQNGVDLLIQFFHLPLLPRSGQLENRIGISFISIEASLRYGVEERKEAIEIFLLDGVVLVVVAARATHGESKPGGCRGACAVHHILHVIFLGDCAALKVDLIVAVEPARDFLFYRRVGKQVAGQLLDGELIERQVAVESVNDPITPGPHLAQAVNVIAMRIGVTGQVEPLHRHALAVVRGLQQLVYAFFVSVGRMVREKRVHLGGSGRQTRQIERNAPQQRGLVSFGRRFQALSFQASHCEMVDRILWPGFVFDV